MSVQIIRRDITTIDCDVIVNPTDCYYTGSGGTDLAVHRAAGPALRRACDRLPSLECGAVAVTEGFNLPCRHILHTCGPVWQDGSKNEEILLRSCYVNSLLAAYGLEAESIAFPLIASGTFGFPKDRVLRIALTAIGDCLRCFDRELSVCLCVFDPQSYALSLGIELEQYLHTPSVPPSDHSPEADSLAGWIQTQTDSFAVTLGRLVDKKGMTDVQCYKASNVSKKTYWKIFNLENYKPGKATVFSFAIGLRLTLEETKQLLQTVGLSFSHSSLTDLIVEFYISHGIYDILEIDAALYQYGEKCLWSEE